MKKIRIGIVIHIFRRKVSIMVSKDRLLLMFAGVVNNIGVERDLTAI